MNQTEQKEQFMQLYAPIHERLCRFVQTLVWNSDEAKDIISDTTLIAFEKFESIRDKNQFQSFLFGIAHHLYLKSLRRNKFKGEWNQDSLSLKPGGIQTDALQLKQELRYWLSKLGTQEREALTLFEISGFSYSEIAIILKISEAKVKAILYRARQTLKTLANQKKGEIV